MSAETVLGQQFEGEMQASADAASPGMRRLGDMIYSHHDKADSETARAVDRVHFRKMGVAVECDVWDNRRRFP